MLAGDFVGEAPALDMYGVETVDRSVLSIDIEVALIDIQQMSLYFEVAAVDTAGRQHQGQQEQKPREASGYIMAISYKKLHRQEKRKPPPPYLRSKAYHDSE